MSTNSSDAQKETPNSHVLLIGLIVFLAIAITTGFVWMQTDHIIAPPDFRLMDLYWRLYICRCPGFYIY